MEVLTVDDFFDDPMLERAKALDAEYKTVDHNGLSYKGIALHEDKEYAQRISDIVETPFKVVETMYRRYLANEVRETYIHSDVLIGTVTGIAFLNLPEQCKGGVAFWKHKEHGWAWHPRNAKELQQGNGKDTPEFWQKIYQDGFDEDKWELTEMVEMKFNRLVLFWSPRYHSRYPQVPFGVKLDDARLVKVFFCKA